MLRATALLICLSVGYASATLAADPSSAEAPVQPKATATDQSKADASVAAAQPTSSASNPGLEAHAPTPAAVSPAAVSAAATPSAAGQSGNSAETAEDREARTEKELRGRGYKVEMRGGQKVFCTKQVSLGSHFETKICRTAEEIERGREASQEAARRWQIKGIASPN